MPEKPVIEFPCDYPITIIGRASEHFDARIIAIINKHQEKPFEGSLERKDSKNKNYQSFSITLYATSEAQLHALFEELKRDDDVIMVL